MNTEADICRFTIFRLPSADKKRQKEALDLYALLRNLLRYVSCDDVRFGEPPNEPDFVFSREGNIIGVELTDLNPKDFERGGFVQKGQFKAWETKNRGAETRQEFEWGKFTLRESLAALKTQLANKQEKAKNWSALFQERWLLMHAASGSPFGELTGGKRKDAVGKELAVADYYAKVGHGVSSICKDMEPFDYVFLFAAEGFVAFSANQENQHIFPSIPDAMVKRGVQVSDEFLNWTKSSKTVRQPFDINKGPPDVFS